MTEEQFNTILKRLDILEKTVYNLEFKIDSLSTDLSSLPDMEYLDISVKQIKDHITKSLSAD